MYICDERERKKNFRNFKFLSIKKKQQTSNFYFNHFSFKLLKIMPPGRKDRGERDKKPKKIIKIRKLKEVVFDEDARK